MKYVSKNYKWIMIAFGFAIFSLTVIISPKRTYDSEVILAIIDSGVDFSDSELATYQWKNTINGVDICGYDFLKQQYIDTDIEYSDSFHGTICAKIAVQSASVNSDIDMKIMSLRVFSDNSNGKTSDVVSAIEFAKQYGAKICLMSFDSEEYSKELFQTMLDSDMIFILSAGNTYPFGMDLNKVRECYPANYELHNSIVVSSINESKELSLFANYGKNTVDVCAVGENVCVNIGNIDLLVDGTSFAAPKVAGDIVKYIDDVFAPVEIIQKYLKSCPIGSKNLKCKTKYGKVVKE